MSILLIVTGGILVFVGIAGCVVPVLPGPPISYISLILLSWAYKWEVYTTNFLIIMGIITVVVTVLDFILPVYLPKRYGASKFGIWGSILGMLVGMIIFPPFGLIIGTFLGAVLGELAFNKDKRASLKAALGVFVGTIAAILLKVSVSGIIGFYFFRALLRPIVL
jgi:uncharacterized protein YqgC (DUF456 family)